MIEFKAKFALLLAVLTLLCYGCFNTGTEIPNELTGRLFNPDGTPANNAQVTAYPVEYVPGDSGINPGRKYTVFTDADGRYSLAKAAEGQYNIIGSKGGLLAYADSVSIAEGIGEFPPDTLETPGSLTGIVQLQPNHDPRTATIQVLGTDLYVNVDASGRFTLQNLAGGSYRLRVVTILPEYVPMYAVVGARAGREDTLPSPLTPLYTGIPVVMGIRAYLDTLAGVARISWSPVSYPGLLGYNVYRDTAGALNFSQSPINRLRVADTFYLDTLYRSNSDTLSRTWEFRVRVLNQAGILGQPFTPAVLHAVPPLFVKTMVRFRGVIPVWDSIRQVDSTLVSADISNRTRPLSQISWCFGRPDSLVATRALSGSLAISDSIRFGWRAQGPYTIYVKVRESGGAERSDSLIIRGNSAPSINGIPPTIVKSITPYYFRPMVSDPDGDPIYFQVTNRPTWATFDSLTGTLSGIPADSQAGRYTGIAIRVTDGRRSASLPSFEIRVDTNPWHTKGERISGLYGIRPYGATTYNNRIYVAYPGYESITLGSYDPLTDTWSHLISIPRIGLGISWVAAGLEVVNDRLYMMVSRDSGREFKMFALAINPNQGSWELFSNPQDTTSTSPTSMTKVGSKLFVRYGWRYDHTWPVSYQGLAEYDPLASRWEIKREPPGYSIRILALGGNIYQSAYYPSRILRYTPVSDNWDSIPYPSRVQWGSFAAMCELNGLLYRMGGRNDQNNIVNWLEVYDPISNSWELKNNAPTFRDGHVCAEFSGRLYYFGGEMPSGGENRVEEYNPALDR